jgi:hydrogenase-1 operon protein HyaF
MTRLQDIPVYTEDMGSQNDADMLDAIVYEIKQSMDAFIQTGKTGVIDIRSLPLSEKARHELKKKLGRGEVEAKALLAGDTEIYETTYSGVWWVTHKNLDDKVVAEHIEIGVIPAVLCAHIEDIKIAQEKLKNEIRPEKIM